MKTTITYLVGGLGVALIIGFSNLGTAFGVLLLLTYSELLRRDNEN